MGDDNLLADVGEVENWMEILAECKKLREDQIERLCDKASCFPSWPPLWCRLDC